jgi:hypothetical protein
MFQLANFKKGDLVMVDEFGKATKYEIMAILAPKSIKSLGDSCYEARNSLDGKTKMISEEDILRRATPVDSSAELFPE